MMCAQKELQEEYVRRDSAVLKKMQLSSNVLLYLEKGIRHDLLT
jgi:hypothetical protein